MARPELIALLTCDASATDPHGKVTLYGLFDLIWGTAFPLRHPQLTVLLKCRFAAPGQAQVFLERPDGEPLLAMAPITAQAAGNLQLLFHLSNVEFPIPGIYNFRVLCTDGEVARVPLEVRTRQ